MRLSRPRFTLRRLMVAVAIVGLLLGFREWMARRLARFLRIAQSYATPIGNDLGDLTNRENGGPRPRKFPDIEGLRFDHDMMMAEKYDWAARHPWLPVMPDPPDPQPGPP